MFVLSGMMVLASLAAAYAKPTIRLAETVPMPALEQIIPSQVGVWHEERTSVGAVIDPQIQSELKRIYTQILSRTYINDRGERIMLSIAYGKDQSDTTQVHYPEICYPAQGFQIASTREEILSTLRARDVLDDGGRCGGDEPHGQEIGGNALRLQGTDSRRSAVPRVVDRPRHGGRFPPAG
jgi:hypothetical protein